MARYIDAEVMPKDEFWADLTDIEKAKVLQYLVGMPTADVAPIYEIAEEIFDAIEEIFDFGGITTDLHFDAYYGGIVVLDRIGEKIRELKEKYTG